MDIKALRHDGLTILRDFRDTLHLKTRSSAADSLLARTTQLINTTKTQTDSHQLYSLKIYYDMP